MWRMLKVAPRPQGAVSLPFSLKRIWLGITENFNLKCTGCWVEGQFRRVYMDPAEARVLLSTSGKLSIISLTTLGEALLHPKFCDILEICKELHPNAARWVISNGTIPIKGRYRQAVSLIDRLGLSIDGSTKDTCEAIRIGANFERFIENVKGIVKVRAETGSPKELCFGLTATSTNIRELAGVVRLAAELGVPRVWAQAMEIKRDEIAVKVSPIHIGTVSQDVLREAMRNAEEEAVRLGVELHHSNVLRGDVASGERDSEADELAVRTCQYPWTESFQLQRNGNKLQVWPCCSMPKTSAAEVARRYGLEYREAAPLDKICNSPEYCRFRRGMAAGEMNHLCGRCDAARNYPWTPKTN